MQVRNETWLAENLWQPDPLLAADNSARDTRRCIAVVAEGTWHKGKDWAKIEALLAHFLSTAHWVSPSLHHTFICLRPWGTKGGFDDCVNADVAEELQKELKGGYEVSFDRVIPVKTGVVLCGTPSVDINRIRTLLRDKGYVQGERYLLDICHVTLLRNVATVTHEQQAQLLSDLKRMTGGRGDFLRLAVDSMHICESSWCMRENEYKIYASLSLE